MKETVKQQNELQSKGHNYLTQVIHCWKQWEVLGCASHYSRAVKSCKIMSVSTGLNCQCAGHWNPAEKSIKGITAFAASGRFLRLVPEQSPVSVSLEMMAGFCQRLLQTHGTQHRWENKRKQNVSQWHLCHKLGFLPRSCPLSNERQRFPHTILVFVDLNTDLWTTPSGIHNKPPFLVHKGIT